MAKTNLLQNKLAQYTAPQEAMAAGIYPYFRAISSEQDPEVIINGKKVLMFGSNCYTGLVNDPRIKEAAIEATKKIWNRMRRLSVSQWHTRPSQGTRTCHSPIHR